ncbi:MAG: hypothetical protein J5822_05395 [Eubacteriaceae bacterium]|nr:hypothetical protein [Eubacteriaceae bacterium]
MTEDDTMGAENKMEKHEDERELIMKAARGDRKAFEKVFEIYNPKLIAICRNEGLTEEQCALVSKKTFEEAARKLSGISSPQDFIKELKAICAKRILELKPEKKKAVSKTPETEENAGVPDENDGKNDAPLSREEKDRRKRDRTEKREAHKEKKKLEKKTIRWICIGVAVLLIVAMILLLLPGRQKRSKYEVPYKDSLKEVYQSYLTVLRTDRPMILNVSSATDSRQFLPTVCIYDINKDNVPELIYISNSQDYVRLLTICTVKGGITQELYSDYCYDLCGMFVSGSDVFLLSERHSSAIETSFLKLVSSEDGTVRLERVLYCVGTAATLSDGTSEYLYKYYSGENEVTKDAYQKAYKKICSGMTLVLMDMNSPSGALMDMQGGYLEKVASLSSAAMNCDDAIEKLMVLTGEGSGLMSPSQLLANLPSHFVLTDEGSTWATELDMFPDGSFNGTYHSYSQDGTRTIQQCLFRGVFSDITSIDGYSFRATLKHLEILETTAHYDVNGYYVVPADPVGIVGGAEYIIYRPGAFTGKISSQALNNASWKFNPRSSLVLPCWAIVSSYTTDIFFDSDTVIYTPAAEGAAPVPQTPSEDTDEETYEDSDEYDDEDYEEDYEED